MKQPAAPRHVRSTRLRVITSLSLLSAAFAIGCTTGEWEKPEGEVGTVSEAVTASSTVLVNQLGYLAGAKKVAVGIGSCGGVAFTVKNSSGTTVATGTTSAAVTDPGSGDTVCKADFSTFATAGSGYKVNITGLGDSDAFSIGTADQYGNLYVDAMKYFQYHRMGSQVVSISLTGAKGGTVSRSWALRPTTALSAYNGWTSGTFNIDGGWADAGDFGLYPDNAVQAIWVLSNLKELKNPASSLYDLDAEITYGAKFLMGVLPSDTTKQAAHKCHDDSWGTQNWGGYPAGNDASASVRHCMGQSITATYAVVRGLSHAARVISNSTTATSYWNQAVTAWTRANGATTPIYAGPSPGAAVGGGDYQDNDATDDKFDAAVEMYLTAKKRGASYTSYLSAVTSSPHYKKVSRIFDWGEPQEFTQGNLSLYAYNKANAGALATEIDIAGIQTAIVAEADVVLSSIAANGYPVPISGTNYPWGSNKVVMHSSMILGYAREATGNTKYTKGMHQAMDYIMGVNTLRLSFITGYGTYFARAAHDRMSNGNAGIGWMLGGPLMSSLINDPNTPKTPNPAKNHCSGDTGWDNCWCSWEVTVDWNAPLAWVSYYIKSSVSDLATGGSGGCTTAADCNDNNVCTVDACNSGVCANTAGNAGTVCRSAGSNTTCDPAETCSGSSTSCPANAYASNTTTCNDGNAGTINDKCNGSGTCAGTTSCTTPSTPSAPTGTAGNAQVALSWSAVSGATSYTLSRATSSGGTYGNVVTGQTSTSYTNTGLTNGTSYYYKLTATNSCGTSGASAASAGFTPAASCTPPSAPGTPTATAGNAQVTLSWPAVSGATSYTVKRSTTSGSGYSNVATGLTSTSYVNTGLTNGTTYYYVISASTSCESNNSTQASAAPTAGTGGTEPCTPSATFGAGVTSSGSFNTTGAYCFRTSMDIVGWQCSSFDNRTMQVNDVSKTLSSMPLPAKVNGYYYFEATGASNALAWAACSWW